MCSRVQPVHTVVVAVELPAKAGRGVSEVAHYHCRDELRSSFPLPLHGLRRVPMCGIHPHNRVQTRPLESIRKKASLALDCRSLASRTAGT